MDADLTGMAGSRLWPMFLSAVERGESNAHQLFRGAGKMLCDPKKALLVFRLGRCKSNRQRAKRTGQMIMDLFNRSVSVLHTPI